MSFFDSVKNGIKDHFDKKKEEQERLKQIRFEANAQRRLAFEDAYRENLKKVMIANAKKDAAKKSGLQKMRAENRLRNLQKNESAPGTFFDKLREHTQRNMVRNEERKKANQERLEQAKRMREERLAEQQRLRQERMFKNSNRAFSKW